MFRWHQKEKSCGGESLKLAGEEYLDSVFFLLMAAKMDSLSLLTVFECRLQNNDLHEL